MFEALARLADRRGRRVVIAAVAFFVVAGALGGSVADRLAPYGADDPATETVEATHQPPEPVNCLRPICSSRPATEAPL